MADGFPDVHNDGTVIVLDLIELLLASGKACRSHPHSAARQLSNPPMAAWQLEQLVSLIPSCCACPYRREKYRRSAR